MEELIKNIREMGMDWFIECLGCWAVDTEIENFEEVIDELNDLLEEERCSAPE